MMVSPAWGSQTWAVEKMIGRRPQGHSPSWSGLAAAQTKDRQDEDQQTDVYHVSHKHAELQD